MTHHTPASQRGKADVPGASLAYEVVGEGPTLVLLHAGIADMTMWDAQVDALAEGYRVVRYDMRGYGDSPATPGPFSHRRDLFALLGSLGIEQAHLVGCSQGAATAIDFALEHPEMTTSLVLVSPAVNGYEFEGRPPQALLDLTGALARRDVAGAADLAARIWADGPARTPDQVDAGVREHIRAMSRVALRNLLPEAVAEDALEPPAIGRLAEVDVPTLAVVGDLDDASILDIADVIVDGIAGAEKVVIPGTAHMLSMEKPDVFAEVALGFLRRAGAASLGTDGAGDGRA